MVKMNKIILNNIKEITTCVLCGEELKEIEPSIEANCDFCGKLGILSHSCESLHYICNECLAISAEDFIKKTCLSYEGTDPIALAVEIMNSPVINIYGPQHHFIVPAVILTCVHNTLGQHEMLAKKIEFTETIANLETPKSCSYNAGMCGAAIGTGIFLKIFLAIEPGSDDEWSLSDTLIAESMKVIAARGGTRCCKSDTYVSIEVAVNFLKEKFAIELPLSEAKCTFSVRNRTCKRENCNFYNLSFSLV